MALRPLRQFFIGLLVGVPMLGFTACSTGSEGASEAPATPPAPAATSSPTDEWLDAALLRAEDLEAAFAGRSGQAQQWTPQGKGDVSSALELRLCDQASVQSVAALDSLHWKASTTLVGSYWVAVQESVLTGETDQLAHTFAAVKEGLATCHGVPTRSGDGRTFTSEPYDIGAFGEDRYATRDTYDDASSFTHVLIRDGQILAHVVTAENPGTLFTDDIVREIVASASEKLP